MFYMYSHGSKEKRRGGRGWYEGPGGLGSQLIHADGYKNTPPPSPHMYTVATGQTS